MFNKIFFICILLAAIFTSAALAVDPPTYELLAPLPGGSTEIPQSNISTYLAQLFTFLLSAAAILALVMLVVGGLQYMGSAGNPQMISDAKGRITYALLGLLLAVAAWLILFTINPALVSLDFFVTSVATSQTDCTGLDEAACRNKPGCSFSGGSCGFTGSPFKTSSDPPRNLKEFLETFFRPRSTPSSLPPPPSSPPPPPPPPPPPLSSTFPGAVSHRHRISTISTAVPAVVLHSKLSDLFPALPQLIPTLLWKEAHTNIT